MTLHPLGTRVRLFPELYAGYDQPELVYLSPHPRQVHTGPSDHQMYVANPVDKTDAYNPPDTMPPYQGPTYPPAEPSADGHFDHIPTGTPQFRAVHLYGCARHTLDIWEHYLQRTVTWWHVPAIPRLELVPVVHWANAHSGPGFLETGIIRNAQRQDHLFCMNFDVIAHEVGHAMLFAVLGVPAPGKLTGEYLALHESFCDLIGLVGVLRFESVIGRLLAQTGGNLHALNMVNRLGRYSDTQQIRIASTSATMADLDGVKLRPDGNWDDPTGQNRNQHALGEPLTGAIFDILVEIFQDGLVSRGVVPAELDSRRRSVTQVTRQASDLHAHHSRASARMPAAYAAALRDARDVVGFAMAHAIKTLHPEAVTFGRVAACIIEAASLLREGPNLPAILALFQARGIDPTPYLRPTPAGPRFDAEPDRPRDRTEAAFLQAHAAIRHGHRESS